MKFLLAIVLLVCTVSAQVGNYTSEGAIGAFTDSDAVGPQFGFFDTANGNMGSFTLVKRGAVHYDLVGWYADEDGFHEVTGYVKWIAAFSAITYTIYENGELLDSQWMNKNL